MDKPTMLARQALDMVAAAMLNGGDGAVGDFGWSITKLNQARPAVREALAALDAGGWMPIDSAPKDGQFVLLYSERNEPAVSIGFWDDAFGEAKRAGWLMVEMDAMLSAVTPTHWMPLPPPPQGERPEEFDDHTDCPGCRICDKGHYG